MKITLIRDLREQSYFVSVERDAEGDGAALAAIPIKLENNRPVRLRWSSHAAFAEVAAYCRSIGLNGKYEFRSIFAEE